MALLGKHTMNLEVTMSETHVVQGFVGCRDVVKVDVEDGREKSKTVGAKGDTLQLTQRKRWPPGEGAASQGLDCEVQADGAAPGPPGPIIGSLAVLCCCPAGVAGVQWSRTQEHH